jgi:hypothetical protein
MTEWLWDTLAQWRVRGIKTVVSLPGEVLAVILEAKNEVAVVWIWAARTVLA